MLQHKIIHNETLKMEITELQEREATLRELTLSASDMELKKKFNLELMAIQEKIKFIEHELKILATPIQQMLPDIFEEKRAIPNSFLRGALFGIVKKGKRALVKDEKIFSMSQYDINFSGEYLDQNDLELWDTFIYLAKKNMVDNELRISLYELCKVMRLTPNQMRYETLINRAKRLKFGMVQIKTGTKFYAGSLIDDVLIDSEGDGKLIIRYNKNFSNLFTDKDYTLISVDIRHALGDHQLARWIYNFYESHKNPIPFKIEFLKKLCRSESDLKEFRRILKHSLEVVKKVYLSVNPKSNWHYEITKDDNLIISKNTLMTTKQPKLL